MTPQLVFDLAVIIGFGIVICVQHLSLCEYRRQISILGTRLFSLEGRYFPSSHVERLEREIACCQANIQELRTRPVSYIK